MNRPPFICLILSLLLTMGNESCKPRSEKTMFDTMKDTGILFENKVEDGRTENSFLFRNFYNGGGVAIGDLNNDGLADVFLTSNMGSNKLFLNKGNWNFEDITIRAGILADDKWNTGVTLVDINNDGWLDIYVCSSGHMSNGNRKNKLYINNHDLTFTESAAKYGLDISAYCTQVSFFDYDLDGDLDCFVIENSPIPVNQLDYANMRDLPDKQWKVAEFLKGGGDHLYRNDNGHFTEVTKSAGIHGSLISFGLGVSVTDINGDGYPDVFVSNDSYERDYLYINQRNGTFKDELEKYFQHTSLSSMGADIADINNDGYPDVFTTDMLPDDDYRLKLTGSFDNIDLYNGKLKAGFYQQFVKNCLQLNNGNGSFSEIADYSGVSATDWSWGALMFDADNDGLNDILVCNGVNRDVTNLDFLDFFANDLMQKMVLDKKKEGIDKILAKIPRTPLSNKLFRNLGNLQFEDVAGKWGLAQPSFANGAAYGDLDNDGDLDLIINNENEPVSIFKNNARELNHNNYIAISLKGKDKNTFAIGSKVQVFLPDSSLNREIIPSRGFQSSVDYKLVIGIGHANKIDSIQITWPDRSTSAILNPAINQTLVVSELTIPSRKPGIQKITRETRTYFDPVASSFEKHQEDNYTDFYAEYNIPQMLSREGPKATVGDVNGDGLQDIFIGGTAGHPGQLYIQDRKGAFTKKVEADFDKFPDFEDGAVLFFDADKDGDLDLLVCPGGNNMTPNSRESQLRLFINDGRANFILDPNAFPNTGVNVSVAKSFDFNGDGYEDLFVGGLSVPGNYGVTPSSFLLQNDGKGHFRDIAATEYPEIARAGMVTNAQWTDMNGDGKRDLVISGLWMNPQIYLNQNNRFVRLHTNMDSLFGWWQSSIAIDVNGDGKMDLVLGNIGENFYLKPDKEHPAKIWINDFDNNGITDKILTRSINGKDMPVFLKHDLEKQVPGLKKQNLKHGDFARKSIQELFPAMIIEKCIVKQFNFCSSIVAINGGDGKFVIQKLPVRAQLTSIHAIQPFDVNADGNQDLIVAGNEFGFLPQFGRLDGGFGDILLGDGHGHFKAVGQNKTGFNVKGQVRDIAPIEINREPNILFLVNDSIPSLYKIPKRNN